MRAREIGASGLEAQELATLLLQRIRRTDPLAGVWEAADIQWWWRKERASDDAEKLFWVDEDGPVAGILLTAWSDQQPWQCDPMVVPGAGGVAVEEVWQRAVGLGGQFSPQGIDVPVSDGDSDFGPLVQRDGLTVGERDNTGWLRAEDRPERIAPADGFTVVDRSQRLGEPHPMRLRNTEAVAARLDQCTLYDQELDLRIETAGGEIAGYALFWFDPDTKVGLVEPVRVEDAFQRRGLANALVREGVNRLIDRGARRVKISYGSQAAAATYLGVGFTPTSSATWYQRR